MKKEENILFKDKITITDYDRNIKELIETIDKGESALKNLFFGTECLEKYENRGKYRLGDHKRCTGVTGVNGEERSLCKCMYYYNSKETKKCCDECPNVERYKITGNYQIVDYEVPAYYYHPSVGNIDLFIQDTVNKELYATEAKPYKGNSETILRMISEILTYTLGDNRYKKAIIFFEKDRDSNIDTPQQNEYVTQNPLLIELIKKADITVFRFEEDGEKGYKICKL